MKLRVTFFMSILVPLLRRLPRWDFLIIPATWVAFDWLRSRGFLAALRRFDSWCAVRRLRPANQGGTAWRTPRPWRGVSVFNGTGDACVARTPSERRGR